MLLSVLTDKCCGNAKKRVPISFMSIYEQTKATLEELKGYRLFCGSVERELLGSRHSKNRSNDLVSTNVTNTFKNATTLLNEKVVF